MIAFGVAGSCGLVAPAPQSSGLVRPGAPLRTSIVEETVNGVTQTLPIDRLGEMRGETGSFGGGDVAIGSESAKRDSVYLTGAT